MRFFRDVANVTMDLDDVERIDFEALGGADTIVVGDLSGTDLTTTNLDLEGVLGGGAGDGQPDSVVVNGTNGDDVIAVAGSGGDVSVFGLQARVNVTRVRGGERPADDQRARRRRRDRRDLARRRRDPVRRRTAGLGDDVFVGSEGNDLLNGGDGDDIALMGQGDDTFVWNPGDDDDTLEGQAGADTMLFNGANVSESIDIAANGGRVRFFRNIANVTMDLNDVERIDFAALGGADTIVVNDLVRHRRDGGEPRPSAGSTRSRTA